MHNHCTLVPIGSKYQAIIPQLLTEQVYQSKSYEMMKTIKRLKVNDPFEGE
jgi:hypothetical protein